MKKCLFLDRDGVINIDKRYVHDLNSFEFIDGIYDLITQFKNNNYLVIVVTNQAGIARGFYTEEDFKNLTKWMISELDNMIDKVYYCPNHPTEGLGEYKVSCGYRKPDSGMFLKAGEKFNIDFSKSIMVGDKLSDLDAAKKVGINDLYLFRNSEQQKRHYAFKEIDSFDSIIENHIKK